MANSVPRRPQYTHEYPCYEALKARSSDPHEILSVAAIQVWSVLKSERASELECGMT